MSNELFNTDKLIDWLRRQDSNEEYTWQDPVMCLMGRYVTDMGTPADLYGYTGNMPYYYYIAQTKPHTFGAALQRAEAIKALPPPEVRDEAIPSSRLSAPAHETPLLELQRNP
jgi:hypothetical protein